MPKLLLISSLQTWIARDNDMKRMGKLLTDEELLENYRMRCSEKEFAIFKRDFEQSRIAIMDLLNQMTPDMLGGIAKNDAEKQIIRRYNRMCRHLNKMRAKMERLSWCL